MIELFTETLSGFRYIILVVVCIILILALIGVKSELKYIKTIDSPSKAPKSKKESNNKTEVQAVPATTNQQAPAQQPVLQAQPVPQAPVAPQQTK